MKKSLAVLVILIIAMVSTCNAAMAAQNPNSIQSDPVFSSVTITLSTYKSAAYSADTNEIVGYIKVVSCWLQKKVDGQWVFDRLLPVPNTVSYNTIGYESYMNYSSYIPSDGNTYRIGARFVADGHYVTRYSNQRTF